MLSVLAGISLRMSTRFFNQGDIYSDKPYLSDELLSEDHLKRKGVDPVCREADLDELKKLGAGEV